jgi:hypothetical protein
LEVIGMRVARWRVEDGVMLPAFEAHLHGRDLEVAEEAAEGPWAWYVRTPHGALLASGEAPTCDAAEQDAEDEATAVHPPTAELLELLLS